VINCLLEEITQTSAAFRPPDLHRPPRHSREGGNPYILSRNSTRPERFYFLDINKSLFFLAVIARNKWIPAFAGMTVGRG